MLYINPRYPSLDPTRDPEQVYPMTSAFDGKYDVMDGVRTAGVLGIFLLLLVVHTSCKGSQNKRKTDIQISSVRV